jgi:hypothetical protein
LTVQKLLTSAYHLKELYLSSLPFMKCIVDWILNARVMMNLLEVLLVAILVSYKLHLPDESNISVGTASEKKTLTNLPIGPVASKQSFYENPAPWLDE